MKIENIARLAEVGVKNISFFFGGMPLIFWYCSACCRHLVHEEAYYTYSKRVVRS